MCDVIPTVDLGRINGTDTERRALAADVRKACSEVGFLNVVNHGVSQDVLDGMMSMSEKFFNLSKDTKMAMGISKHFRGYTELGGETTLGKVDYREQVDFGMSKEFDPEKARENMFWHLNGPNQYPAEEELPGMEAVVEAYMAHLKTVGDMVMRALALSLDLDEYHFVFRDHPGVDPHMMKIIHYPRYDGELQDGAEIQGLGPHNDAGYVTLLMQDQLGLQAQLQNGQWIDVQALPGAFCVNLGNMMQVVTRHFYIATRHQVVIRRNSPPRTSVAYFYQLPLDFLVDGVDLPEGCAPAPDALVAGLSMAVKQNITVPMVFGDNIWKIKLRSHPHIHQEYFPDEITG